MKLKNIDISLSRGQLIWGKKWGYIIFLICLALIFPIITIVMLCFPVIWNVQMIIAIIMLNLLSVFILIFPFILIFKDYKIKKDIAKWLRDAVVIKAYSKKTGEKECLFLPKGIIIQVAFEFNNKTHVKDSDIKVFGGNKAYLASFKKYADKMINIAYSPQYDEVMILKDDGGGM